MVRTPKFCRLDSSWRMSDAGVIGYEARKTGSLASCPAATRPQARAVLPLMFVYVPGSKWVALTAKGPPTSSAVSPKLYPALKARELASATAGVLANRLAIQSSVSWWGRLYIHDTRPRAKKFLARSASRDLAPLGLAASMVSEVMGTSNTVKEASDPSVRGLVSYPALARLRSTNASAFTISVLPATMSARLARRAAGFMATSTFGESPGVRMSWSEMWIWNADTPARVPAGARISAG